MRLGILADVHGNLPALEAVLAALEREAVAAYVCAGDLVGYGPSPEACVERVLALPGVCVAGNHDLMAIGRLPLDGVWHLARATLEWTASVLPAHTREALATLPLEADAGDDVLVTHGGLGDPTRYVRSEADAGGQLRALAGAAPAARVLVLGHTHVAQLVDLGGRRLVNPGSVGQSRDRHAVARAAVLETETRDVRFLELDYDVAAARRALRAAGLPEGALHLPPPGPVHRARTRLARALGRRR